LLAVLALAGCGAESESAAPEPTPSPAAEREPAPDVEGTTLAGERLALADYEGRPVFVLVWSSWWTVCRSEAVAFAEFARENPQYSYLGLNVADRPEHARLFVRDFGWRFPSISDPDRERARRLGADYQPVVILVDAEGGIVGRHEGRGDEAIWSELASRL
jgi:peroxiredoxin